MMFGKQTDDPEAERHAGSFAKPDAAPLLQVRDLSVAPMADSPGLSSVSFDIRPGEILGIAGIDGNGQKQLAEALSGPACDHGRLGRARRARHRCAWMSASAARRDCAT